MGLTGENGRVKMENPISEDNARVLLQVREQLRHDHSGRITNLLGFTIVANAAIWGFFAQSFVKFIDDPTKVFSSFLIAGALSAITMGIWRWYVRVIDDQTACFYPEIMRYEIRLCVLPDEGIRGYLSRVKPNINPNIEKTLSRTDLTDDQKLVVVRELVKAKRIGTRGLRLWKIDLDTAIWLLILGLFVVDVSLSIILRCQGKLQGSSWLEITCLVVTSIGFAFALCADKRYQRDPSGKDVEEAICKAKKRRDGTGITIQHTR